MLRGGLLVAILAWALHVPSAEALVQVDKGISGVRLDNSKSEVRAALGKPRRVIKGETIFGPFTEYRYRGGIRVNFQGNRGVTAVETTGLGDRTRTGVGVGSSEQDVRDGVARIRCATFEGTRICQTKRGAPGQRLTFFFFADGQVVRVSVAIVID
jgi:hypothetical protein